MVYHYCQELQKLLAKPQLAPCKIYHYTAKDPVKRVNSAFLICAFGVLAMGKTAAEMWSKFAHLQGFLDYRDASMGACTYKCTVLHCLKGLEIAIKLGWLDYQTFNLAEYEYYERLENGDMNWIIPGKLLAMSCPSTSTVDESGFRCFTPEDYAPVLKKMGISAVVRLNNKTYQASVRAKQRFTQYGLRHYELYFLDGSVPTEEIAKRFVAIVDKEKAVAVHCKAGLGRTGTLIGIYAMQHYNFPPAEFIGWIRICRPGSVLGPQQQFLISIESVVRSWTAEEQLAKAAISPSQRKSTRMGRNALNRSIEMSPEDQSKASFGEFGQAERLITAKRTGQSPSLPTSLQNSVRGISLEPLSSMQHRKAVPGKNCSLFSSRLTQAMHRAHRSIY